MKISSIAFFVSKSLCIAGAIAGLLAPVKSSAANLTVTSLLDSGAGTLRQALLDNAALGGGNTVLFSTNLSGAIAVTSGQLPITKSVTIVGPGAQTLAVSGNKSSLIFVILTTNANVSISGLTISGGNGTQNTGGTNSQGGGIFQQSGAGQLTVSNCFITGNAAVQGGGLCAFDHLLMVNSTVATNVGQLEAGGIMTLGTAAIYNCTVVSNLAGATCSFGGGIVCFGGTLGISGCTIVSNIMDSTCGSGGGIYVSGGTVNITNSIVAQNTANSGPDCSGTFQSGGYNLIGKSDGSSGFANGVNHDQAGSTASPLNPMVAALGYYGAPTPIMPLINGSPAIDKGKSSGLTTDQRGRARPTDLSWVVNASGGDGSDIGAFEYDAPGLQTLVINLPITGLNHAFSPAVTNPPPSPGFVSDLVVFTTTNLTNLDLSQYGTLAVRLFTTNGQQLIVNPPSNCVSSLTVGYLFGGDAESNSSTATLSFEGFSGATPVRFYNFFANGGGGNAFIFEGQENIGGSIAFSALKYSYHPVDYPTNTPKTFVVNTASLIFSYTTPLTNDPGPFVTLGAPLQPQIFPTNGQMRVQWPSRSNLMVQLQSSTNLPGTNWQNVATLTGNGLTNGINDPTNGKAKAFYRLKVLPPN